MLIKKITNFTLEKISPKYYQLLFNYYNDNKNHLEPWEPTRAENYYTLDFHIKRTDDRLKLMNENKSMHLIMLNDSKSEIMGVCNYTKIKDGKCWLGYSISSKYEGRGYMYEGVIQGNEFMFREYQITQLKAGVIIRNKRSEKLISRLGFIPTGKSEKMEINSEVEQLEIYKLTNPASTTSLF